MLRTLHSWLDWVQDTSWGCYYSTCLHYCKAVDVVVAVDTGTDPLILASERRFRSPAGTVGMLAAVVVVVVVAAVVDAAHSLTQALESR